jgi:hypothetical protein
MRDFGVPITLIGSKRLNGWNIGRNAGEVTMSKDDDARAAGQMKWLLLVMLQKRHANWHELADHEQRAMFDKAFEEIMDGMVEDGIFRCVGVTSSGSKVYRHGKAGRSPHLVVNPPEREQ